MLGGRHRLIVVAFLIGLGASAVLVTGNWAPARTVVPIHTSWGFDLGNEAEVASYAHVVVVAEVTKDLGVVGDQTLYEVAVESWFRGRTPDRLRVAQLGFTDGRYAYEMEDQHLMVVGKRYLLVLTAPSDVTSDVMTVMAGPLSAQPAMAKLIARLERGMRNPTWPAALDDEYEAVYRASARSWAEEHVGFDLPVARTE